MKAKTKKKLGVRVLQLARPHVAMLGIGMLALALASGINLFFPHFIRQVLNGQWGFDLKTGLPFATGLLIVLFAFQALFFFVRHYAFSAVGHKIVAELRTKLFHSMLDQEIGFFDISRTGDLLSRLTSDTQMLQRAATINISVALRYIIQVIGGTVLMAMISLELTLVILLVVPLLASISIFCGKRLRAISRKMQNELGEANVVAEESINAIRTVRAFSGVPFERAQYSSAIQNSLDTGIDRSRFAAVFTSSMVFLFHSAIAIVIWFGGSLVLQGDLSMGDLTAFVLYCVIAAVSLGFLAGTWDEFMQAVGASERIFEIIDRPSKMPLMNGQGVQLSEKDIVSIEFKNVSFNYSARPDVEVLSNISFKIPPGSNTAFVGPSGSGKSTIAALILRFYETSQGKVVYGEHSLNDISLASYYEQISVVSQTPEVFSVSLLDNIRYARPDAKLNEVEAAAEAANLGQFINSLPKGYNTLVGDKGIQLSGGERQRIAIARALLRDPKFLILDEATSSLDSENEHLIQLALKELLKGRTTMVIAHRLSTVQEADQVLVLKSGQICQQGTHQSLIQEEGMYKTFVQHQLL